MNRSTRRKEWACRLFWGVFAGCLGLVGMVGCNRTEPAGSAATKTEDATAQSPAAAGETSNAGKPSESRQAAGPADGAQASKPVGASGSARAVLEAMVAAYRSAKGYADKAELRMVAEQRGQKSMQAADYSVVMSRPNKIRMRVFDGVMVSNGTDLSAYANNVPNQVIRRAAPGTLSIRSIYSDEILVGAFSGAASQSPTQAVSWVPVQLLLLLADDPLKTLLFNCKDLELLEPAKLDDHECQRVQLIRPDGKAVLWIDRQSSLLRRLQFPTEELVRNPPPDQKVDSLALTADFTDAKFEDNVHESAFQFEISGGNQVGETLVPPPYLLLGKPAPDFSFVGEDGKKVDPKSLKDKIVILDFWAKWCEPCRAKLPLVEKAAAQYKSNPKVVFLAVSVDKKEEATDSALRTLLTDLGVTLPLARDPDQDAGKKFQVMAIPATYILGADGRVQDYQTGFRLTHDNELAEKIKRLLAGEDLHREPFKQLDEERRLFTAWLDTWLKNGLLVLPQLAESQEPPKAVIAPRSEPKAFRKTSLWKCTELKDAGNLLVVTDRNGAGKLLALHAYKNVSEIGTDGKVLTTHALELAEKEAATLIRSGAGKDGKPYFALFSSMCQQVHLFDGQWKRVASFPAAGPDASHAGIADVQLADLDGDGTLKMFVAYFGDVGVQSVALDGTRLGAYRGLSDVARITALGADPEGHRNLLCTNRSGSLVTLDRQFKRLDELKVGKRLLHWITSADLDGDQRTEIVGLALDQQAASVVGVGPRGEELWSHDLPQGAPASFAELIVPGQLTAKGPAHWLVSAPDGSILVIAADGKLVDQFAYGETLNGIATMAVDGKPVLVVSTRQGLEAWRIEW